MPEHKLETLLNLPKRQIAITEARNDFAEVVNRVAYSPERVDLTRRERVMAGLIPVDTLALIDAADMLAKTDLEFAKTWQDEIDKNKKSTL